jgi:hypothetical protein
VPYVIDRDHRLMLDTDEPGLVDHLDANEWHEGQ